MPRVYGGWPGSPRSRSGTHPTRSPGVYSRSTGSPEIVVNLALPSSSRFTPDILPTGRSGDFASAGRNISLVHRSSAAEGRLSGLDSSLIKLLRIVAPSHREQATG